MMGVAEWFVMLASVAVALVVYLILNKMAFLEERPEKEVELNPYGSKLIPASEARRITDESKLKNEFAEINKKLYVLAKAGKNKAYLEDPTEDQIRFLEMNGYNVELSGDSRNISTYLVSW